MSGHVVYVCMCVCLFTPEEGCQIGMMATSSVPHHALVMDSLVREPQKTFAKFSTYFLSGETEDNENEATWSVPFPAPAELSRIP